MKTKNILIILFVALAITLVVFFIIKYQKKKKLQQAASGDLPTVQNVSSTNILEQLQALIAGSKKNSGVGVTGTPPLVPSNASSESATTIFPLKKGDTGLAVKVLQAYYNIPITGVFDERLQLSLAKSGYKKPLTAQDFVDLAVSTDKGRGSVFPLKKGSKNNYVKVIQTVIGMPNNLLTGNWATNTEMNVVEKTGANIIWQGDYQKVVSIALGIHTKVAPVPETKSKIKDVLLNFLLPKY